MVAKHCPSGQCRADMATGVYGGFWPGRRVGSGNLSATSVMRTEPEGLWLAPAAGIGVQVKPKWVYGVLVTVVWGTEWAVPPIGQPPARTETES